MGGIRPPGRARRRRDGHLPQHRHKWVRRFKAEGTAGITHKRIRPYDPQTNGKGERFNRTLQRAVGPG
jgi:transposase InsO family protein